MEESASMLCARVMRGISSIEKAVTPASARLRMASGAPSGSANPMTICPRRSRAVSGGTERTCSRMSAVEKTASRVVTTAPAVSYAADVNPAAAPASCSTTTSSPVFFRAAAAEGMSATRCSPGHVSRGTPTFICGEFSLSQFFQPLRDRGDDGGTDRFLPRRGQRLRHAGNLHDFSWRRLLTRARQCRKTIGFARRNVGIELPVQYQDRLLHARHYLRWVERQHALEPRRVGLPPHSLGNAIPSRAGDHGVLDPFLQIDPALPFLGCECERIEHALLLFEDQLRPARAGGVDGDDAVDFVVAGGRDQGRRGPFAISGHHDPLLVHVVTLRQPPDRRTDVLGVVGYRRRLDAAAALTGPPAVVSQDDVPAVGEAF